MSDGKPNPNSRHSKYSIEGDKLVRKAPFAPILHVVRAFSLPSTKTDGPAESVAIPPRS